MKAPIPDQLINPLRHLKPHLHLASVFGDDWFGRRAESFARFFGTPKFLIGQTVFVLIWIVLNVVGVTHFDRYPFILLNLAFSLQAAYAAPLILLAQTRQADRDSMTSEAHAKHREEVARQADARQEQMLKQSLVLEELIKQNTDLTLLTQQMSLEIRNLAENIRSRVDSKS